ncbi:MAG: DUF4870 domain-containing protein [Omnitrophica WOR_2 bacterium]
MNAPYTPPTDVTSDDKLWALLAYVLAPFVSVIILLMEDKKNRPWLKAHAMQALVVGVINLLIGMFLGWLIFPLCLNLIIEIVMIYWGLQAYNGNQVVIPVVTDFVKQQGWA